MKAIRFCRVIACVLACVWLPAFSDCQDEEGSKIVDLFYSYIDVDGMLSQEGITPEAIASLTNDRDALIDDLLKDREATGSVLAKIYEKEQSLGARGRQTQLMGFAQKTGIGKTQFLGFARKNLETTNLDAASDPLLSVALEYLGEHGDETDLVRMQRIDDHSNSAYLRIRDRYSKQLTNKLSTVSLDDSNLEMEANRRGKVSQERNASSAEKSPAASPSSKLPWILGAIAFLIILVILVRAVKSKSDTS